MLTDLGKTPALAHEDGALLDETCRLTDRLADALAENGFARHFVPERWGGGAGTFTALLDAVSVLAETCAAHGRLAAYLPEAGQREVWGDGPDVRVAASVMPPQGSAVRTDGGWRLTGRWTTASGVDQAEWVLLASWTPADGDPAGEAREHRIFAVRRPEVTVLHTWHPVGLRGTGSNTVEADVLVPGHLGFTVRDLGRVQPHAARCHTVPFPLVAGLVFAAPVLGAAEGALRTWWDTQSERMRPDGGTAARQHALTKASAHIQSARMLLERAARRADHAPVTPVLVAENQRDVSVAVELCGTAADELFRTAGLRALDEGDALQRRWRDITTARAHRTLDFGAAAAGYAGALLAARTPEGAR